MQNIFEVLKPPFRYDSYGQMIFDSEDNLVLDVRAWGLLQYKENGEMLQDDFGSKVAEGINYIAQHGNGAKPAESCPECNGTGSKIIHNQFQVKCDSCKGTGKLPR